MDLERVIAALAPTDVVGRRAGEVPTSPTTCAASSPVRSSSACPGSRADGHDFAAEAVERGAVALVVERPLDLGGAAARRPVVARRDGRRRPTSSSAARREELEVVGVTGTNGKTTTAFLAPRDPRGGRPPARADRDGRERASAASARRLERTTPEAIDLQRLFREMLDAGDRSCAMEASSHASEMHRLDRVRFRALVFTNLTQDHLDFHGTMERVLRGEAAAVRRRAAGGRQRRRRVGPAARRRSSRGAALTFGLSPRRGGRRPRALARHRAARCAAASTS